ncbi:MAG: IPT/TIG domain-containing protein [Terriglobales bacterium]
MRWRIPLVAAFLISSVVASRAGGPAFVAGSGYASGVEGQPLIWANGSVQYFTDQGDLSPILPSAQADSFVASAFSTWTSISGVALTAAQGGHLAEDVNGSNIATDGYGTITGPADITSSATGTPIGIVYDYDGTVTDALLGQGAGDLEDCFTNAVYGGPDNFYTGGNIVHAFVALNGVCAATSAQLPDVQYRLVRVLGRILGLGWSQANLNVLTRNPSPTSADYAGFPVMHFADPISCVPISACYPNAAAPTMDDITALARLYPAIGNQQTTGRIYGSVYFTDASGNAVQPMQGVNVVARLIDGTGQPSRQYVVTSVSGFAFHGNAGNIIDGYVDGNGLRYDRRWGSNDPSLEGFFDLGQLTIPTGQTIAQYQLSVEALDPNWSLGVEPYAPTQVTPSGSFAPVVVTVPNGSNAERDILMLQDEIAQTHPGIGSTYANPATLPAGGGWGSWLSGYGSTDWFEFTARANRTASVAVTALDETGRPTETKLLPVIGIWQLSDQSGGPAPASTPSAFNSATFGMSRLDAQFSAADIFRVGIADYRGDGRPDYFYQASLLYSDTVTPARLSLSGGVTTLNGIGFSPGLQVNVGGNNGNVLSASASQIELAVPAGSQDGTATIQVTNPVGGAFSQMIGALTYGALATDRLLLLQGAEPATPVGSAAANAIRVRAVAADGVTPVSGATLAWSATNGLQFSVCGGLSSCSLLSDEAGESASWVTPTVTGQSTITIALAPASYSPPQTQQATVVGTSSTLDLVAVTPTRWIGQGATIAVPLTVEALDLGVPIANVAVNFTITKGTAALSSGSGTTNGSGFATVIANLTNQNADVQVSACVAPNNKPCQTFTLFSTPSSLWTLETVSGSLQVVPTGESFQPLVMRVTDGSLAANPVMGVTVTFETTLARVSPDPVILGSSQAQAVSAQDGLASIVPSVGSVGPCDVFITVSAGRSTVQLQMESVAAIAVAQPKHNRAKAPTERRGPEFDAQAATPQGLQDMLFAFPQGDPLDEPVASQTACSDARPDTASSADSGSGATGTPASGDVVSRSCASPSELPHAEAETPRSPIEPAKPTADPTERDHGGAAQRPAESAPANAPSATKSSASSPVVDSPPASKLLEDRRNCRFAQSEGGVFFGALLEGLP